MPENFSIEALLCALITLLTFLRSLEKLLFKTSSYLRLITLFSLAKTLNTLVVVVAVMTLRGCMKAYKEGRTRFYALVFGSEVKELICEVDLSPYHLGRWFCSFFEDGLIVLSKGGKWLKAFDLNMESIV